MGSSNDWDDILDRETLRLSQESKRVDQAEGLRSSSDDEDSTNHAAKRRRCNQTMTETGIGTEEVLDPRETGLDQPWWVTLIQAHISDLVPAASRSSSSNPQQRRHMKVLSSCTGTCAEGTVLEAGSDRFVWT